MFSSVARVFRRSFFAAPPRKSRHELVSEAHIAYMQAHERSTQVQQRQPRQAASLSPSASTSSLSTLSSFSSSSSPSSSIEDSVDTSPEESPFESLCLELQRVEEFTHRRCRIAREEYYC